MNIEKAYLEVTLKDSQTDLISGGYEITINGFKKSSTARNVQIPFDIEKPITSVIDLSEIESFKVTYDLVLLEPSLNDYIESIEYAVKNDLYINVGLKGLDLIAKWFRKLENENKS